MTSKAPVRCDVSVIVPCFNAARYIGDALESILSQAPCPREIIVVDDGSTDSSRAEIARFGDAVFLATQANQGAPAARNLGLARAASQYIAFLDADDLWTSGSLAARMDVLAREANLDFAYGLIEQFISPEIDAVTARQWKRPAGAEPGRLLQATLFRRVAFDRVGPFDPTMRLSDSFEWFARAADRGVFGTSCGALVLRRRIHSANSIAKETSRDRDYLRALRASLVRRRAPADAIVGETR